jgi:hypothetical protein
MCELCDKLRAKCIILFPLAEIGNRAEIEDKIEEVNEILNSMGFSHMEKHGLKFCLNNTKILDQ